MLAFWLCFNSSKALFIVWIQTLHLYPIYEFYTTVTLAEFLCYLVTFSYTSLIMHSSSSGCKLIFQVFKTFLADNPGTVEKRVFHSSSDSHISLMQIHILVSLSHIQVRQIFFEIQFSQHFFELKHSLHSHIQLIPTSFTTMHVLYFGMPVLRLPDPFLFPAW